MFTITYREPWYSQDKKQTDYWGVDEKDVKEKFTKLMSGMGGAVIEKIERKK